MKKETSRKELELQIEEIIASTPPGAALKLGEVELAERFGVSRTPVREALIALEGRGLIASRPNAGFEVCMLAPDMVTFHYPLIGVLEGLAVRESVEALRASLAQIEDREGVDPPMFTTANMQCDRAFHAFLISETSNEVLRREVRILRLQVERFERLDLGSADPAQSMREHRLVLAAIRSGNGEAAEIAIREHTRVGSQRVLSVLEKRGASSVP